MEKAQIKRRLFSFHRSGLPFLCLIFLSFLTNNNILGQEFQLKGRVLDQHSEEPIPFANVYLAEDPTLGVAADLDGLFVFLLAESPDSIMVSAVGYEAQRILPPYDSIQDIKLEVSSFALDEVVVTPGEDPAVLLFKEIVAHKPQNNFKLIPKYQCEAYTKISIDLIDITDEFKDVKLLKPFGFIFDNIDSTTEAAPFMPLLLSESLTDIYYSRKPSMDKKVVKATKITGIENESLSKVLVAMNQTQNVYQNWIEVMTKKFISPVADGGLAYYKYRITDTAIINGLQCYQLQFSPKSKSSPAFSGDMWVHDSTYAVCRINMFLDKVEIVNFVEKVNVLQTYDLQSGNVWVPESEIFTVSFVNVSEPLGLNVLSKKVAKNAPRVRGKSTTTFRAFDFGGDFEFGDNKAEVEVLETASEQPDSFWLQSRHVPLSSKEAAVDFLIDTVKNLRIVRTWKQIGTVLSTGYVPIGPIELGNLYGFSNINEVEKTQWRASLRTGIKFSKRLHIDTYLAYGVRDKRWKYGAKFLYLLKKSPRRSISGAYFNNIYYHLFTPGTIGEPAPQSAEISTFFRRRDIPQKLLQIEGGKVRFFQEWPIGYSIGLSIEHQHVAPFFNFSYLPGANDTYSDPEIHAIDFTEVGIDQRLALNEQFISGDFQRLSIPGNYPVLSLRYRLGLKNSFGDGFEYHKIEAQVDDNISLMPLGVLDVRVVGGKIWGRLPYLLLKVPDASETHFLNRYGFNLLYHFDFAMDEYGMVFLEHHFNGLIFNKVKLFRALGFRGVTSFRGMYGTLSSINVAANKPNLYNFANPDAIVRVDAPDEVPYMEFSVGIENILRFLRVDYIHKLSYHRDDRPDWGLRLYFSFQF